MPDVASVMAELKSKGRENTRAIYSKHGMDAERLYGVSVADLKVIAKPLKNQQALASELYATGVMEAMYLAGMLASGALMSPEQLQQWAEKSAGLQMISEYTVPWVTVENPAGRKLALEWIESEGEVLASVGWSAYSGMVATTPDAALDLEEIEKLLSTVVKEIHSAPNRVRSRMNSFVIAVGTYVAPLTARAKGAANAMGVVMVDVGDTACKVPSALDSIAKAEAAGKIGKKKKTIRC